MVQLSVTRCSGITILWVSLESSATITFCVASQRVCCCCCCWFRYRLSPETFGYTLVSMRYKDYETLIKEATYDYTHKVVVCSPRCAILQQSVPETCNKKETMKVYLCC
jgi:hypothetical protein